MASLRFGLYCSSRTFTCIVQTPQQLGELPSLACIAAARDSCPCKRQLQGGTYHLEGDLGVVQDAEDLVGEAALRLCPRPFHKCHHLQHQACEIRGCLSKFL